MISTRSKELTYLLLLCLVIGFSVFQIVGYWRAPNYNVKLHQGVGQALAEQALEVLNRTGRVVVLTLDPTQYPALKTQIEAFTRLLKMKSAVVVTQQLLIDSSQKRKLGPGVGLTSHGFVEFLKRSADADALVSFVGTPNPADPEIQTYEGPAVKFIAETQARGKLHRLFERKLLSAAIVPRFTFPAPGPANPRTPEEWFERNFQVVRPSAGVGGAVLP
jgi:hypothetical protein